MSRPPTTAYETSTRARWDWRDDAACQRHDPELFFPIGRTGPSVPQIIEAKRVCWDECPEKVRKACKAFATDPETRQDEGIWGGEDEEERRRNRRKRDRERQALRKQGY